MESYTSVFKRLVPKLLGAQLIKLCYSMNTRKSEASKKYVFFISGYHLVHLRTEGKSSNENVKTAALLTQLPVRTLKKKKTHTTKILTQKSTKPDLLNMV